MNRFVVVAICLSTFLFIGACERPQVIEPSGNKVKVAVIGPFSGLSQAKGKDGLQGIKTAEYMHPYLYNGDAIELLILDDKNDPVETVTSLNKIVQDEQVAAAILLSSSEPLLAVAPRADILKIPILAVLATNPEVTRNNSYVTQVCFDDIFQGTVAALFVRDDLLADKVAVFRNPRNPYSLFLADEFMRNYKSGGGEITNVVSINNDESDLTVTMQEVRDSKPDLLYMPIKIENVMKLITAAREIAWKPKMMGSDGLLANALNKYPDEVKLLEGVMATDFYSNDMPLSSYGQEMVRTFDGLYDDPRTSYTALAFEGYALLQRAMNRCENKTDRDCINNMLRQTDDFSGIMGKVSLHQNGKASRPIVVNTIDDGALKFIVKVY